MLFRATKVSVLNSLLPVVVSSTSFHFCIKACSFEEMTSEDGVADFLLSSTSPSQRNTRVKSRRHCFVSGCLFGSVFDILCTAWNKSSLTSTSAPNMALILFLSLQQLSIYTMMSLHVHKCFSAVSQILKLMCKLPSHYLPPVI